MVSCNIRYYLPVFFHFFISYQQGIELNNHMASGDFKFTGLEATETKLGWADRKHESS